MENRIFVSRKGDKVPILLEEISYDLGKTWTPTGKSKYDEENIEIDSCECSDEQYKWTETREEISVDGKYYCKITLQVKYGCENWKNYLTEEGNEIIRLGDYLRDDENFYEDEVFHKEEEGEIIEDENGDCYMTYDEYIWYDGKWLKINCEPIKGEKVDC